MTDLASAERPTTQRALVRAALAALGKEHLVLAVHDASFPSREGEETGRGSPYTAGGRAFLTFVSELGFDGVQFGPQGETSISNPSPYDGSAFSKGLTSLALAELATESFARLLHHDELVELVEKARSAQPRARYALSFRAHHELVGRAARRLSARVEKGDVAARALSLRVHAFAQRSSWLRHDALFQALVGTHGTDDWRTWPLLDKELLAARNVTDAASTARIRTLETDRRSVIEAWTFGQFVLDAQHNALRALAGELELSLYGDLQVGLSHRDTWSRGELFLSTHVLGAPPSRTNPEGQPWGYPVFDPRRLMARFTGSRSVADMTSSPLAFFEARVDKVLTEFDGLRIDHPHGLVCPWVYEPASDPACVRDGARLYGSPDDPAHPDLAPFAIARPEQIDTRATRHADDHITRLDEAQVEAYAVLFDVLDEVRRRHGRPTTALLCEVLSTCPLPLRLVMQRAGLGRFRITQKAKTEDPTDGYRSEHAEPDDWIMVGNHDTPPLLAVVDRWQAAGAIDARAAYLAARLEPVPTARQRFAETLARSPAKLVSAMFAELFTGRAKHVMVFFADLFGTRELYNTPGIVRDDNWQLRVPTNFREAYGAACARGESFDLPRALALAMRARGEAFVRANASLIEALEARAALNASGAS